MRALQLRLGLLSYWLELLPGWLLRVACRGVARLVETPSSPAGVGAVEVLDALNLDTKLFCPPDNTDNLQRVRTIVSYIDARPERKNEDFRLLANEAMAKAWPCKR